MRFAPTRDLSETRPYVAPHSVNIETIETIPGRRLRRIGSYAATRYGRCVYGTQSAVYGKDNYNQCTYE